METQRRFDSVFLYHRAQTREERLRQLRESVNSSQAERMGGSGWVGFDMFREYNEAMSSRNSRIYSALQR